MRDDDDEWQEFATLEAARHEATEAAREILSQAVLSGNATTVDVAIVVLDEAGATVLAVPIGRVVGTDSQV